MNQTIASPRVEAPGASAEASTRVTRALLAGGVLAGPLFIGLAVVQALTRAGFDPRRHPLSLLSVGDLGWIQITNFVVAGLLFVGAAVGLRRVLHPGRGGTWGPRLIGAFGVSLIAGGVFVADPGLGFPPGAPEGIPEQLSWHGLLHAIAPPTGFLALIAALFVLARRFVARRQPGWATACVAIGVAIFALSLWSNLVWNFLPLWIGTGIGFGWISVVMARLMPGRSEATASISPPTEVTPSP